ncbi:DciA family protein [Thiomicrorhabdus sp. zzn3]|uniref:DciA family protein n=1 Tax=Thiomicrorhabdus sp. zzn3 TaxID=3039775 RepID=UPI00243634F0|nr:DciA family protein [Thiomicrorhabdus sp. zzn3]MDG6778481.1 DciA family protein [Thiomicrorhabdus sp. zzn3]
MKPLLNKQSAQLENLIREAQLFQALLEVGQDALPSELKPHLVGVSFEKNTLILQLDDNLWATQLRFHEPNLLGVYQSHFPHLQLRKTKIKIIPISVSPQPKRPVSSSPSEQDAKEMLEIGEKVQSKGLRDALHRLSLRAQEKRDSSEKE